MLAAKNSAHLVSDVPAGLSSRSFKIFCWFMRNRKTIQIIKWNLNSFIKSFNGTLGMNDQASPTIEIA